MTDRLTPGMLRDLADLDDAWVSRGWSSPRWATYIREEAARREAEPVNVAQSRGKAIGCGRKLMPKGLSVDALRSANISIGGCEVCTTPTGCKQEKHCDHFNMAFYSEREGPGSAAAPTEHVFGHWYPEDKPAPAADRNLVTDASTLVFKQLEASEARVRELEYAYEKAGAAVNAEKARNDRLAAAVKTYLTAKHDLRQANRADDDEAYRSALIAYEKSETELQSALTSEGGDRG